MRELLPSTVSERPLSRRPATVVMRVAAVAVLLGCSVGCSQPSGPEDPSGAGHGAGAGSAPAVAVTPGTIGSVTAPAVGGQPVGQDPTGQKQALLMGSPMDAYRLRGKPVDAVSRAVNLLADACLRRQGFTPRPQPPYQPTEDLRVTPDATTGYHQPPDPALDAYDRAYQEWKFVDDTTPKTPAYEKALAGPPGRSARPDQPDGGCLGEAQQAIAGPGRTPNAIDPLARQLYDEAADRAAADRRYVDAVRGWASCMKAGGYSFSTMRDAENSAVVTPPEQPPSAAELTLARADIACQSRYKPWLVLRQVGVEYESRLVQQNLTRLAPVKAQTDRILRRVAEVLTQAPAAPPTASP